jgi:hypothetical protein
MIVLWLAGVLGMLAVQLKKDYNSELYFMFSTTVYCTLTLVYLCVLFKLVISLRKISGAQIDREKLKI